MNGTGTVAGAVPATADDVFAFLTDVDRLPDWNAIIQRVVERPATLAPGAEWVVELKAMAGTWRSRSRVEEFDRDRRVFAYRSGTDDGNPSYAVWRWEVEPDPDGGSRVKVSWDVHPETFWRRVLLAQIRSRQLRREVPTSIDSLGRVLQETAR